MKYRRSVYRSLALITQFGINMLVPIFLCVMAGVYIGKKFEIDWITIPLFAVGALAGFRNIFIMAKKIYSDETPSRHSPVSGERIDHGETFSRHLSISEKQKRNNETSARRSDRPGQHLNHREKDTVHVKKN